VPAPFPSFTEFKFNKEKKKDPRPLQEKRTSISNSSESRRSERLASHLAPSYEEV